MILCIMYVSVFLQCFKSTLHFQHHNSSTHVLFPTCKYNFTLSFMCLELLITIFPLTGNIIWISFFVLECHTDILYFLLSRRRRCPFHLEVIRLSGEHTVWEQVPGLLSSVTPVPLWQPRWVFHTEWFIHSQSYCAKLCLKSVCKAYPKWWPKALTVAFRLYICDGTSHTQTWHYQTVNQHQAHNLWMFPQRVTSPVSVLYIVEAVTVYSTLIEMFLKSRLNCPFEV